MTESKAVQQQIRQILNTENDAIALSDKLFSPGGLFNQLARTEAERRSMVQSRLFKKAQRKSSELRRKEASQFANAVEQARERMPGRDRLVKIERP